MALTQSQAGKAFEYALLNEANNILSINYHTNVIQNAPYIIAHNCFNLANEVEQNGFLRAANAAIRHMITLEPKLEYESNANDILELQLMPDIAGQQGDVRDVLFIRSTQNWTIGISAKNNHKAVKHSRLSDTIDFGASWLNVPCSQTYFNTIIPIFQQLRTLKTQGLNWNAVPNKHQTYYIPVLDAFRTELLRINAANDNIPGALVSYLIGRNDFYKVIKGRHVVEILGFNINNTLNRPRPNGVRPPRVHKLLLPAQIVQLQMKPNSTDTLILICDNGWTISFRIHNAETRVVPSLKFDINLDGHPQTLYSHQEPW